jgi:hypothetical protein
MPSKSKSKSKSEPPHPVSISPETAHAGDRIVLRFAKPIHVEKPPRVTVGGKPLVAPLPRDRYTLIGCVPDDKPGKKEVRVEGHGRAALTARSPLLHKGLHPPFKPGAPLNAIMHHANPIPLIGIHHPLRHTVHPASTWYMTGANVAHDANAHALQTVKFSTAWTRPSPTPNTSWYAEPIVYDDPPGNPALVLAPNTPDGQGEILALVEAATGMTRWALTTLAPNRTYISSAPVCVDTCIYVVWLRSVAQLGPGQLELACLDGVSGGVLWTHPLQQAVTSETTWIRLAAAYDSVYVLTTDGTLRAINPQTGALQWELVGAIPTSFLLASDESLAVGWGRLYVGSSSGLRTFDAHTGAAGWMSTPFDCSYAQIVISNRNPPLVIVSDFNAKIYAFNALTGAPVWTFQGDNFWPKMTCDFEHLFVAQGFTLIMLDLSDGALLGTSPNLAAANYGAPSMGENRVFHVATPNEGDPLAPSILNGFSRSSVAQPLEQFGINRTDLVRPVVHGDHVYVNVLGVAGFPIRQDTIQAIRIR